MNNKVNDITMKKLNIKINGKNYSAAEGESVLSVAEKNNLYIPTLCHHPDLKENASCRLCLVEIVGLRQAQAGGEKNKIETACSTIAQEGMEIKLDTAKVKKIRKLNLELLISDHLEKCDECNRKYSCKLKNLAKEFGIEKTRFADRRHNPVIDEKTPALYWDSSKCVECGDCLSTCEQITGMDNIGTKYYGSSIIFGPKGGRSFTETNCIFCGQCILHCPSGSLMEKYEVTDVEKRLAKKRSGEVWIAQFAPSTRYSIGELFGLEPGVNLEKKLVTALKNCGFDYVFDTNVGADITTIEEAAEFLERFQTKKNLPMFTACCPAWVRFAELFHHELIPNLTTTKSPNHCIALAIKTYFAKKIKVSPKSIKIVAINPCTSKKYEQTLFQMGLAKYPEIDYVFTVREAANLLKNRGIDLPKMPESEFDSPFGQATGAGTIYGTSGGVMESALRTVASKLDGKEIPRLEFTEVRGMTGVKTASVEIDGTNVEVAVVSGMKNAQKLLRDMKSGVKKFDYIEVMACPGGCLGGGGQPIPTTSEIRQKRMEAFYADDKTKPLRRAHLNKDLLKMYEGLNAKPLSSRAQKLFHRSFIKRKPK